MNLRRALCAFVVGLWPLAAAAASVPVGSEFLVNSYTLGDENDPDVAAATGGGFMAVWVRGGDGSGAGVFGRVYDASGAPIGTEFQVNTYTEGGQRPASVAADAAGRFVVVWSSDQDGEDYGVFGQRFDSGGQPLGSEFQVNTYTYYAQGYQGLSVAADASGDFVVAWSSYYQDGYGYGVFAQRFDNTGATVGTEFQVNTYTIGNQGFGSYYGGVTAAKSASGSFVVVWSSYYQDGYGDGVFARHYDNTGVPTSPSDFQVNTYTTGNQGSYGGIATAGDGTGNFVVAWTSYGQAGYGLSTFAQRLDNSGTLVGTEFQVNTYTLGDQGFAGPSVAADAGGEFVITWASGSGTGQDGSGFGVFGQRYENDGTPIGLEFQANTFTLGHQWFPSVASDWGGCSVVVWRSGVRSSPVPCVNDIDCPKYPLESCEKGMCQSLGQQDGYEGGIFGQRYCRARPLDHYKCYKVKDLKKPKFAPRLVTLVDQFVSETAAVIKPFLLCTPVDKNGEGISDPSLHQCCYKIKSTRLKPSPTVLVASQFQRSTLSPLQGKFLCAPCTKRVLQIGAGLSAVVGLLLVGNAKGCASSRAKLTDVRNSP